MMVFVLRLMLLLVAALCFAAFRESLKSQAPWFTVILTAAATVLFTLTAIIQIIR